MEKIWNDGWRGEEDGRMDGGVRRMEGWMDR